MVETFVLETNVAKVIEAIKLPTQEMLVEKENEVSMVQAIKPKKVEIDFKEVDKDAYEAIDVNEQKKHQD